MSDTPWQPEPGRPLGEQLAGWYAQRIQQRTLAPGARLPSVRQGAQRHGVSPATVVAAYDQLQARGLVEAQRQRGFFVRGGAGAAVPAGSVAATGTVVASAAGAWPTDAGSLGAAPALTPAPALAPPVDATALMRGMFQGANPGGAHARAGAPGLGTLPEPWLDAGLLERALKRVLPAAASAALRYGEPAGDAGLRRALAQRLSTELGIATQPAQIVTTLGATHALDLVARTLLHPGDAVLVDEPGWAIEFARLTRLGMRLLPVPRGADGPDLAVMAALLAAHRPRLYVTTSVLHNPTGQTLSLAAAHRILQLAEAHGLTVVEDDTYAWLAPGHAPRLAALDGLQRTLYVSGFSKILAPGWRVGYVAASPALAERLVDSKLLSALTTPTMPEMALAWCLEQGLLRRHAERVQQRLAAARQRVVRLAEDAGCRVVTPPQGLFGWLDAGVDTDELARRLAADGWLMAPGSLFHVPPATTGSAPGRPAPCTLMRVNFASTLDARFWAAFGAVRKALIGAA